MLSAFATSQLKLDVSVWLAYLLYVSLMTHHSTLVNWLTTTSNSTSRWKRDVVTTDASLTVILVWQAESAYLQKMHTDTGHDYLTAHEPKREYCWILTSRDGMPV